MQRISKGTYQQSRTKGTLLVRLLPGAESKFPALSLLAGNKHMCRGLFMRALLQPGSLGFTQFRVKGHDSSRAFLLSTRGNSQGFVEFSGDKAMVAAFLHDFYAQGLRLHGGFERNGISASFGHISPYGWENGNEGNALITFKQCFSEAISQEGGTIDILPNGRVMARNMGGIDYASFLPGVRSDSKVLLEALNLGLQ